MKNNDVVFGTVKFFCPNRAEPDKGYGFVETERGDYYVPMWACRKIANGPKEPEFSEEECRRWPYQGDEVVLIPDKRPPVNGGAPRAWRWGYRKFWDLALQEIKDRPFYQVRGENRFKGQVMNSDRREEVVIDCATMEELQARYPRGAKNDFLGTEEPYRSSPCQRINQWYVWKDGDWQKCPDPRPALVELENGLQEFSEKVAADLAVERSANNADLEALVASTGGRNRGVNHTQQFREAVMA